MTPDTEPEEIKSKSQIKREMLALQALGEALVKLSAHELARIEMPEELRDAVHDAQRIRKRGAHKRQLQYIGRLMRQIDPQPIQSSLDKLLNKDRVSVAFQHRIERWRDRLLSEGDAALTQLLDQNPSLDRQHLRQLLRNAHKELKQEKPPRAARELFRYLGDSLENDAELQ